MRQGTSDPSVMSRHLVRWQGVGLSLALSLVLAACGNIGPLRMPDQPDPGVSKQKSSVAERKGT
jgi:predicted small lipoprotein YifL